MPTIPVADIKSDLPTAEQAVRRAAGVLATARVTGTKAVKIIHGYGSTGVGGRIRTEVRKYLNEQLRLGKVRAVLPGEDFTIFNEGTLRAFQLCPALRQDSDLNRYNNGVTIVVL